MPVSDILPILRLVGLLCTIIIIFPTIAVLGKDDRSNRVHFGIVTSTFYRKLDPDYLIPLHRSLASISSQTYSNWTTLILVGDGLPEPDVVHIYSRLQQSNIPSNKVIFHNMNASKREENVLKDKHALLQRYHVSLWSFAGLNALNEGLDVAHSHRRITHIARLDDDDKWEPFHLELLAKAY